MNVLPIFPDAETYGSNAYLAMGEWKRLDEPNTLIDTGGRGRLEAQIAAISAGVGKKKVEQVILTHSHFDHIGGLAEIIASYAPEVLAFAPLPGVTCRLHGGELLRCGSGSVEVIHVPGHSQDSICLYDAADGILFSGDTPMRVYMPGGTHSRAFMAMLERLAEVELKVIYPGHGPPITEDIGRLIRRSLDHARQGRIVS